MRSSKSTLLLFAHCGMEMSWLYAWIFFLTASILDKTFPLPEALGAFFLAAVLTGLLRRKGLMVISALGLHILGFLLLALRTVFVLNYQGYTFLDRTWLADFFTSPKDPLQWLVLVVILVFILLFWISGIALARRPRNQPGISGRFDLGLGAFFGLFLIIFILEVKEGIRFPDPAPVMLMFAFFIFSLTAIGLSRLSGGQRKDFLAGYKGLGVLVSFTFLTLACGAGLVLLFMPYLTASAEAGYAALKTTLRPLGPVLVHVLRVVLTGSSRSKHHDTAQSQGGEGDPVSPGEDGWGGGLVETLVGYGLLGLIASAGSIFLAFCAWRLLRWLFSRPGRGQEKTSAQWGRAWSWLQRLGMAIAFVLQAVVQIFKRDKDAVQIYHCLLRWGYRSGLAHYINETPSEYGSRLKKQFPFLRPEIERIIEALQLTVYAEKKLTPGELALTGRSWKRLRSPRYWPARLKSLILQPAGNARRSSRQ